MEFLNQLSQLNAKEILALGVIGSLITAMGSFIAMIVKDFFFARSFERWKERRSLETVYQKYKDPIVLSAIELIHILRQISENYPPDFFDRELLAYQPEEPSSNSNDDDYYRKYKLVSSVFRLCAFLGWLELYRQDIVYLNSGHNKQNSFFEDCLQKIRSDLADGQLNEAENWVNWKDALLFREEQRAIGETMISTDGSPRVIIGYGKFCSLFDARKEGGQHYWIRIATNFFLLEGSTKKDFRLVRVNRLITHLTDLIEILDKSRSSGKLLSWRSEAKSKVLALIGNTTPNNTLNLTSR